jgi:hypothetical protein
MKESRYTESQIIKSFMRLKADEYSRMFAVNADINQCWPIDFMFDSLFMVDGS